MKILAVGDLVGESGVKKLKEILPNFRKENNIDFVIVNAENSAGGMGITTKIFNDLKKFKFGYSNANCIVKLDKKADKEHLSGYGKLVSFEEMKQQTERSIQTFIKESVEEDILWAVVIIFGIIATSYLIGKNRRYVWGIYLMLGEKPKKLLKIHLISNAINYIIGVIAALVTYKIMYKNEEVSSKTDINQYHIMIDLFFLVIMMAVSLISSLYILKIEPKEILTQTKE